MSEKIDIKIIVIFGLLGLLIVGLVLTGYLGLRYYQVSKSHEETVESLSFLQSNYDAVQEDFASLDTQYQNLSELHETLKDNNALQASRITDLEADYQSMFEAGLCDDTPNISYTSNDSASSSLEEYILDKYGLAAEATFDLIWIDVEDAFHYLESESGFDVFIVFFEDPNYDAFASTFYLNEQCWLNID